MKKTKKHSWKFWTIILVPTLIVITMTVLLLLHFFLFTPSRELEHELAENGDGLYIKDLGDGERNRSMVEKWFNSKIERMLGMKAETIHYGIDYELEGDFSASNFSRPASPDTTNLYEKQLTIIPEGKTFYGKPFTCWFVVADKLSFGGFTADPSVPDVEKENAPNNYIHDFGQFDNKISIANLNSNEDLDKEFVDNFTKNVVGFTNDEIYTVEWSCSGRTTDNIKANQAIDWDDKETIFVDSKEPNSQWDRYYMYLQATTSPAWISPNDFTYGVTEHIWFSS